MIRTDELAYVSASDLAGRIRRRELSPVEFVEATPAEQAVMSGAELGPLHGVPTAIKDLFDFKPGWKSAFGGIRALKDNVIDAVTLRVDGGLLAGNPVMAHELLVESREA